jgi:hypothetical protein
VLEYGILSGGNAGEWLANLQQSAADLATSPFFWPGLGLSRVLGIVIYKLL